MSAIFPTSTPWQAKHDFDLEGRTTIIGNVDGEIIDGTPHHSFDFVCRTIDEDDDSQSRSIAVANADFIVRAANSHHALLSALIAAHDAVRKEWMVALQSFCVIDAGGCPDLATMDEDARPYVIGLQDVMEQARKAIALAGGDA